MVTALKLTFIDVEVYYKAEFDCRHQISSKKTLRKPNHVKIPHRKISDTECIRGLRFNLIKAYYFRSL